MVMPGTYSVDVDVGSLPLAPDRYTFDIGSRSGDVHSLDYIPGAIELEVVGGSKTPGFINGKGGCVRLMSNWIWGNIVEGPSL